MTVQDMSALKTPLPETHVLEDYVYLDTLLSFPLEQPVESISPFPGSTQLEFYNRIMVIRNELGNTKIY